MNAKQYQRATELFDAALRLDPDQRAPYIAVDHHAGKRELRCLRRGGDRCGHRTGGRSPRLGEDGPRQSLRRNQCNALHALHGIGVEQIDSKRGDAGRFDLMPCCSR